MARKSSKNARLDAMTQFQRNRQKKAKLYAKRNDAADWTDRVKQKLDAEKSD